MRENLILKLDVLQAQRAQLVNNDQGGIRINRTKHILSSRKEPISTKDGMRKLELTIQETKDKIINRKKYHACIVIRRILKQFKKLEPLRIKKRMKAIENEEKCQTLIAEIEMVNRIDVEKWAQRIVSTYFTKHFTIEPEEPKNAPMKPVEINVNARIGKLKAIRSALSQLAESCKDYAEVRKDCQLDLLEYEKQKDLRQNRNSPNTPASTSHVTFETKYAGEGENAITFESENESESGGEEIESKGKCDDSSDQKAAQVDPFFDQDIGLPELHQGFINGSDDDVDDVETIEPQRKNRRGQRARRKIWEQKFGNRANHVVKEIRVNQEIEELKAAKKRKVDERRKTIKRQKLDFDSKPIHPSWEAKQRQKQEQSITQFRGKKIQF